MAKTLQQAGGKRDSGVLPTSQEITASTRVTPTKTEVGNKLAGDVMSIMGSTADVVQKGYDASVKASKRVASDNLTELSKALSAIEENTQPNAESKRNAQKANEAVYQYYGRKTFDNEDAQRAYDDSYHQSGATTIASKNSALEVSALKDDADTLVVDITSAIQSQVNANIPQTSVMYNGYIEGITSGGYYTKLQAENIVSKIYIQDIQGDYETLKNLPIYKDGKIDMAVASEVYNNVFDTQSKMVYDETQKDNGGYRVEAVGDTDSKIVNEQQNAFNALLKTFTEKNPPTIKIDSTMTPKTLSLEAGEENLKRQINERNKAIQRNNSGQGTYSTSNQTTDNKNIAEQETQNIVKTQKKFDVGSVIDGTMEYNDVIASSSHPTTYYNATLESDSTSQVTFSETDNRATFTERVSDNENIIDNSTNQDEIDGAVMEIAKLETNSKQQITSTKVKSTYTDLNDGIIDNATSLAGMNKQVGIANVYAANITDNNKALSWLTQKNSSGTSTVMEALQAKYKELDTGMRDGDGKIIPAKEQEAMIKYNFFVHTLTRKHEKAVTNGQEASMVRQSMTKLMSDKDLIDMGFGSEKMTFTTLNTMVADSAGKAVNPWDMEEHVKDMLDNGDFTEISSSVDWILVGDSVVIMTPDGAPSSRTIVDRIETDIAIGLEETEFANLEIGESSNVEVSSDRIDGQLGTVVIVRHKQTGAIMYSKVYTNQELSIGVLPEDEDKLRETKQKQRAMRDERIVAEKQDTKMTPAESALASDSYKKSKAILDANNAKKNK